MTVAKALKDIGSKIQNAAPSSEQLAVFADDALKVVGDAMDVVGSLPGPVGGTGKVGGKIVKGVAEVAEATRGKGPEMVEGAVKAVKNVVPEIKKMSDTGIEMADDVVKGAAGSVEKLKGLFNSVGDKTVNFFKKLQEHPDYVRSKEAGSKVDIQKYVTAMKETLNPAEWEKVRAFVNKYPRTSIGAIITAGAAGAFAATDPDEYEDGTNIKQLSDDEIKNWKAPESPIKMGGMSMMVPEVGGMSTAPEEAKQGGMSTAPEGSKKIPGLEELQKKYPNLNIKTSIVDYMKARGMDSSKENRAKIAKHLGVKDYDWTAEKNIELFKKIMEEESEPISM